ncbi:MAG: CRISPR-associated protein Cas5 [bacterium]|nr:CRISPR-associated protein Cas5 [bacterium]
MATSTADQKRVMKVVIAGAVTSFRYPHFVQGVQPTYDMPPPSTLYGLLCAVTGTFEPPEGIEFGVHFTYEAKFRDLEHIHLSVPYGQANPFQRELLFNPRLTLYLAPERYADAFSRPVYPLALGRSQDLMSRVGNVELMTLERADRAYFEHTLLPVEYAPRFQRTIAATMARYINPRRVPAWGKYAILKDRVLFPDPTDPFRTTYEPVWVDPTSPTVDGLSRGVVLHRFV